MRCFMVTGTVGLLSGGGTCDGISVYYHHMPRPGNPRRASTMCDTTVMSSRTPRRMHIALFTVTPAGAQRGHREDPGLAQERSLWTHPPTPSRIPAKRP